MYGKVGKALGGISPLLAVGTALFLLFGPLYGFESGDSEGNFETGTASAFELALEGGDRAVFFWAAFVVVVSIVGAMGALANRVGWVWVSAVALWGLAALSIMSIGLFVAPLAIVMFASAALITVSRAEPE